MEKGEEEEEEEVVVAGERGEVKVEAEAEAEAEAEVDAEVDAEAAVGLDDAAAQGTAADAETELTAEEGAGVKQGEGSVTGGLSSLRPSLFHVTHVLEDGGTSATVPFPMLVLYDALREGTVPQGMTCRWVLPLAGSGTFVSLWLARDVGAVQAYVDALPGCVGSCRVSEVGCGYSYGLGPQVGFPSLRRDAIPGRDDATLGGLTEVMGRMGASVVQSGEEAGRKMGEVGKMAEGAASKLAEEAGRAAVRLREDAKVAQEEAARVAKEVGETAERSWAGFLSGVASAASAFEHAIHRAAKPNRDRVDPAVYADPGQDILDLNLSATGTPSPRASTPVRAQPDPVDAHDVELLDALLEETA